MTAPHDTHAYLERHLHDGWSDAQGNAEVLVAELADLSWAERLQAIDWFFWKLGARLLDEDQAEAVIDRRLETMRAEPAVARYVEVAEHTLAAVLMQLDTDPRHVTSAHHAVIYAVSPLAVHRNAFEDWLVLNDADELGHVLLGAPGHAFVLMARSYDDTFLALRARDAFWTTMLGRDVGF
ncbi:MAG: hypothetical protein EA356_03835 [Geminicoccaceae bacterium]|nr:MAG: hypothetical protein EA356_03835 [Geminicoccaceae bacterium]